MHINPFIIYLWGIADNIHGTFITLAVIMGLMIPIFLAARAIGADLNAREGTVKGCEQWAKRLILPFVSCVLLAMLMPSSNTIAVMVIAPAIVDSKVIQQDVPEIYAAALSALKGTLLPKDVEKK